jgi:hypothetical protein
MKIYFVILATFLGFQIQSFSQTIVVINRDYNQQEKYESVLINKDGKVLRKLNKINKEDVSNFSEGVWIWMGKTETENNFFFHSNFLNEQGNKLLANDIDGFAYGFSDGWCLVNHKDKDGTESYYYVDKTGKVVFKPVKGEMGSFYKGITWKKGEPGSDDEYFYGLINKKGDWILKPTYFEIKDFNNGIATVMTAMSSANGSHAQQWAYINTKGELIDPKPFTKKYEIVCDFSEGVYMVGTKIDTTNFSDKIAFNAIDSNGKELFTKTYFPAGGYQTEKNMVFKNGLCPTSDGYINKKGEVVIQFPGQIITDASCFQNGLASFKLIPKNGDGFTFKYVVVNVKGIIIWQSEVNKLTNKFEIKNYYFN